MTSAVSSRRTSQILAALVTIGVVLRLVQYAAGESLWIDEAMLALNIEWMRPLKLISSGLYFRQVAPPIYLLALKGAVTVMGPSEYALRLPAVLSSIAALILFVFVARRALTGVALAFAVGLFAVSPMLVTYSAEVKQYAGDLFAAVLLTLVTLELRASGFARRNLAIAAATGLTIVWFSQPSVIVLGGLILALGILALLERDRRAVKPIVVLGLVWGLAAAASIFIAGRIVGPAVIAFMRRYWRDEFMPLPPVTLEAARWMYRGARSFYEPGLGFRLTGGLCVAVAALGLCALWRKGRRDVVLLFSGPVVVSILASAARQYPFTGRLSLFLFPAFIIGLAAGIGWIAEKSSTRASILGVIAVLLFAAPPLYGLLLRHPPWWREDIKPVLAYVAAKRQPGEAVYAFTGAQPAMMFYASRYGFRPGDWTRGGFYRRDTRAYLNDVDYFRGRSRVWLVFAHGLYPEQRRAIVGYADVIGFRRDSVTGRYNGRRADAVGYLFDFSDSVRLKSTDASKYPLPK